jgi:hypothetical protein
MQALVMLTFTGFRLQPNSGALVQFISRFLLKRDEIWLNRHRALVFLTEHDLFG